MKVILQCTNLIGDSIYLLNPVKCFLEQHPDECVAIVTDKGFAFELFFNSLIKGGMFEPIIFDNQEQAINCFPSAQLLYIGAGQSGEICFAESQKPGGKQLHISEGYARILGVKLDTIKPTTVWTRVPDNNRLEPFILISPFSRSCASHSGQPANKTIEDWKWTNIINYLRKQNLPIKVLAGPNDYLKNCPVSINDYITCNSLFDLELVLKSCKFLVTLDNGIGHVAAALEIPMIYLWPKVSNLEFIYPGWNKKATCMMIEPTQLAPVALFTHFRKVVRALLMEQFNEETLEEVEA